MYEILWGPRSSGMYDPNDPQNENLEPYTSNMQEIMANVPPAGMDSASLVATLKRVCNGNIAGCAYSY